MRSALCFLLLLLAFPRPVALSLSEQRTAVVELCSNFSGFLPGIQQDLLPWSRSGVTEQTRDAAFELARHKWSRLSFALRSGTLYLVDPKGQFEAGARDGDQSWSFMGVYIASLFALSRAHGDLLPECVIGQPVEFRLSVTSLEHSKSLCVEGDRSLTSLRQHRFCHRSGGHAVWRYQPASAWLDRRVD